MNTSPRTPPPAARLVGWYDPTAPTGRRLSEDHGWQPAGTIPVYILEPVGAET